MPIWTFVDYVEASGRNPFAEWLAHDVPPDAKTAINNRFLQMAGSRRWPDKWASAYEGYPGIFEARIPWNGVQYRPLFMYAVTVRWQIILLNGATERGGKLVPRSAMDTASTRREAIIRESTRVERHKFD